MNLHNKFVLVFICLLTLCLIKLLQYSWLQVDNQSQLTKSINDADTLLHDPSRVTNSYKNNNIGLIPAELCSSEQREKIRNQLLFEDDKNFNSSNKQHYGRFREYMFDFSKCVESSWINELYVKKKDKIVGEYFLGISVGCNKGFDAIKTARMGMANELFNVNTWGKATLFDHSISVCKQNTDRQADINNQKKISGEMHCIEPMPNTFTALKNGAKELKLDSSGFVLNHAAVSTTDGILKFPTLIDAGVENIGIGSCNGPEKKSNLRCEDVPVYSLDSYANKFVKSNGPVNILQIDVEGFDFNVLFGASSVLDRTHYVEFEYHHEGNWKNLHLVDAVRLLDGKGFTCYWAGLKRLWRITECFFEIYKYWHGWSNVACVHRSQSILAEKMENVFLETLELW